MASMLSSAKIFDTLLEGLTLRQKEVLVARFGLEAKKPQTLEAIGKTYGVTRERVRQIEAVALSTLRDKVRESRECAEIFSRGEKRLKEFGGIAQEEDFVRFVASFVDGMNGNHLALLIEAGAPFRYYEEDDRFHSFYYLNRESLRKVNDLLANFTKSLKERKEYVLDGGYETHLASFVKRQGISLKLFENCVPISKKIMASPYGDIGLAEWPVIHPRTIRDKIYLVLRRQEQPVHFRTIADLINRVGFDTRKALAPTVHNELIKDKRFVLVGRGIYGLKERGYEPGIARDVIKKILKANGPMKFPQVVLAVQKERFFKSNTVLANLQNKTIFERLEDGNYRARES